MPRRSPRRSGARNTVRALPFALALLLAGCLYSFTGGGLPAHIRTIAVLPFENNTSQGVLSGEVEQALQRELPRTLGVRLASEENAHAVIRGRITTYDGASEAAVRTSPDGGAVSVPAYRVRMSAEIEIYDQVNDAVIWRSSGLTVIGDYRAEEGEQVGQRKAIEDLVNRVVLGAQSQW